MEQWNNSDVKIYVKPMSMEVMVLASLTWEMPLSSLQFWDIGLTSSSGYALAFRDLLGA